MWVNRLFSDGNCMSIDSDGHVTIDIPILISKKKKKWPLWKHLEAIDSLIREESNPIDFIHLLGLHTGRYIAQTRKMNRGLRVENAPN